jgi:iron complex outermembrane receptor protein
MKRIWLSFAASTLLIAFLFAGVPYLFAADTDDESSDEFTLEEITVTAQKRSENQQKVAIAMDVISGEELAASGKMDVDDILSTLSNVTINYSEDGMRIGIRGLTNTDSVFNSLTISNPVVAVNTDGAYDRSSSSGQNMFDVERVEVLYGPQSTMYASNSPGGIVNVVTAAPKTDKYSASGSIEFGNFGLFTGQAMVNAPVVSNQLALRLAVQTQKRDSYISGVNQTGEDTKSARLKALYQPNDDLSLTMTGTWSKKASAGFYSNGVIPFDTEDGYWYVSGVKSGKVTDPWTASSDSSASGYSGDQISKGITLDFKWDTKFGSLSVVPSYSESNSDNVGEQTYQNPDDPTAETFDYTQYTAMESEQKGIEARLTSPAEFFFDWILGVNYYKSLSGQYSTADDDRVASSTTEVTDDNKAIFANVTYPITDTFRGVSGIRYSSASAQSVGGLFSGTETPAYEKPDYKLGVEYDAADNSMLYATYATSYRVNAFRTGIPPETAKTYTIGAKNRFFNNRLQLNGAAYYYNYQNVQVQASGLSSSTGVYEDEVVDSAGNPVDLDGDGEITHTLYIESGGPGGYEDPYAQYQYGAFRTIGVDISAELLITSKDRVSLSATYLDSEWTDCKIDAYLKTLDSEGNVVDFWEGDGLDYEGMTRTFSPKWTGTLSYQHNFILGSLGTLTPHMDIMYKSHYVLTFLPSDYPVNYQESYYTIDANMTYSAASNKWSLNAYVKNATDYAAKTMYMQGMESTLSISSPRTFGAVLSLKF